jgi:hypothetical protein
VFFTFVFFNYVNSGYVLVLCPPVFAFVAVRADQFLHAPGRRAVRWSAAAAALAINCAVFGFAPLYCTSRGVRDFERELISVKQAVSAVDARKTLIMGFDSHFLGYRHAGYYLPEFVTVQYPEVAYPDGMRVFVMHGRDTAVVRNFSVDQFERFILFPLPEGAEYSAYTAKIRARLPKNAVRQVAMGNRLVLAGSSSVLSLLFPSTATKRVYTAQHPGR